jgi:hypothetical protein
MEAESSQSESENWSIGENIESVLSLPPFQQSRKSRLTAPAARPVNFNTLCLLNE